LPRGASLLVQRRHLLRPSNPAGLRYHLVAELLAQHAS